MLLSLSVQGDLRPLTPLGGACPSSWCLSPTLRLINLTKEQYTTHVQNPQEDLTFTAVKCEATVSSSSKFQSTHDSVGAQESQDYVRLRGAARGLGCETEYTYSVIYDPHSPLGHNFPDWKKNDPNQGIYLQVTLSLF